MRPGPATGQACGSVLTSLRFTGGEPLKKGLSRARRQRCPQACILTAALIRLRSASRLKRGLKEFVGPGRCRQDVKQRKDDNQMSEVAERVKKIVVEHLGVEADKVSDSASFIDDLGADSLDIVELVMAFEEEFGCEIPDDAAEHILTVGDAVKFLEKNANAA